MNDVRRWICVATIAACLPYLLLKLAWVLGWSVGVSEEGFADTTRIANAVTAGLELVAIGVAVALAAPWARGVPAFAVAFPAWVATGLLVPVAIGVVLGTPVQLLAGGGNPFTGDEVLAGWVFALVYGGFALQALLLLAGFVLHASARWPAVFAGCAHDHAGPTRPLQDLLGGAFVVAGLAFALQQGSWAVWGGGTFPDPDASQRVFLLGGAAAAAAGAMVSLDVVRGRRLTPFHLALAWAGTAVTFTSTFLDTLKSVTLADGTWGSTGSGAGSSSLTLLILLCSLGGAIGGALRLVEACSRTSSGSPEYR